MVALNLYLPILWIFYPALNFWPVVEIVYNEKTKKIITSIITILSLKRS